MMTQPQLTYDGQITVAVGQSRKETAWKNKQMQWSHLLAKFAVTTRTRETQAEYLAMNKGMQDEIKDVGGFVFGVLRDGHRKAENVAWRHGLTLDMDFAPPGFWSLFTLLYDCAACVYSTHKHRPDAPRLRIVAPTSRPTTPDESQALARMLAWQIGIDYFDDTTYEPSRLMYYPSTSADGEYVFEYQDGPWIDVDATLALYGPGDAWKDPSNWPESGRTKKQRQSLAARQGDPLAKTGLIGAFCRSYSIAEAIEAFLPETYTEAGPGRWTYVKGSTSGGAVEYEEKFLYSHHGTDPISGRLVNAWDLVRIHLFESKDEGAAPGTPAGRLPSYIAMAEMVAADEKARETLGRERLAGAKEDFDTIVSSELWMTKLDVNKWGAYKPTRENVRLILRHDPNLKEGYGYNEFSCRPVVTGELPWRDAPSSPDGDPWQDNDDAALRCYIERVYGISAPSIVYDALSAAMGERGFHPVRNYFSGLWWDGVPRLDTLFIEYLGAEDSDYVRAVSRKFFVAAVSRIMRPGIKFDYMPMLVGPQGIGKSKLLRAMAKYWFNDSITTVQGKDACEALRGFLIIEMAEMNAFKKAEIEAVKNYLTKQEDAYRESYGRRTNRYPRQCVFAGTTNDDECLRDRTGARRFWAVDVTGDGAKSVDDLDGFEVDQVWAEALEYYNAGETLYLSGRLEQDANAQQEMHTEEDPQQGLIQEYLDRLLPENWDEIDLYERRAFIHGRTELQGVKVRTKVCTLEVWTELFEGDIKGMSFLASRNIANTLRKLWRKPKNMDGVLRFGKLYGRQRCFTRPQNIGSVDAITKTVYG